MSIESQQERITNLEGAIMNWASEGKTINLDELNSKAWFARWREIAAESPFSHGIILFIPGVTIEDVLVMHNKSK